MMRRTSNTRGINVIGTILMLVTFFLVIGFGIGALATMNLNLSGRSVNTVKANQLAEAAVAEVMNYAQQQSEKQNQEVDINQLAAPSLYLEDRYDGTREVFEPVPSYIGENCHVDVHFKSLGGGDTYYSTENINNPAPRKGARGDIPPFTIDCIVNVTIGSFEKHYQVWITRKWDYALYCESAPIHLLSCYSFAKPPPTPPSFSKATIINGSIFSRFNPDPAPATPYHHYISVGEIPYPPPPPPGSPTPTPNPYWGMDLVIQNIPPSKALPPPLAIGGNLYERKNWAPPAEAPVYTYISLGALENNSLNGRGAFSFPQPTPDSAIYVYPSNNPATRKVSYGSRISSPLNCIKPIDDGKLFCNKINENTYSGTVFKIARDYYGIYRDNWGRDGYVTVDYDLDGNAKNSWEVRFRDDLRREYERKKAEYETKIRTVYFVQSSLVTLPDPNTPDLDWGPKSRYVIKSESGDYYPLVDIYQTASVSAWTDEEVSRDSNGYTIKSGFDEHREGGKINDAPDNKVKLDDTLLVVKGNIELQRSNFSGENTMLQVEGNVSLSAGKISAGKKAGIVIYCNNFNCTSSGSFRGVIFARNSVKIGNPYDTNCPEMRGSIVIGGADPDYDPMNLFLDNGGMVSHGLSLTYDPSYLEVLNRFGTFRITTWKDLN